MRFRKRMTAGTDLLLILALVVWAIIATPVLAQEEGSKQFSGTVGPYEINVVETPSNLSLSQVQVGVTVLNAATGQPVPDARVVLRTKHEVEGTEGWALALNTPDAQERYQALMNLEPPGIWRVSVEISSSLGKVSVEAPPVAVSSGRNFSAGSFVFLGVSLVLVLGVLYLWWTIRREQQKHATELTMKD